MELFALIDKTSGKTIAEATSREACEREASWHGGREKFVIRKIGRESTRFGWSRPNRYVAPWPETKIREFRKRYEDGEPITRLADYFDTSEVRVTSLARKLGIPYRTPKKKSN